MLIVSSMDGTLSVSRTFLTRSYVMSIFKSWLELPKIMTKTFCETLANQSKNLNALKASVSWLYRLMKDPS